MTGIRISGRRNEGLYLYVYQSSSLWGLSIPLSCNYRSVDFSVGVKLPGLEADHSHSSSVEFKNACIYTSAPHTSSWRGGWLRTGANLPLLYVTLLFVIIIYFMLTINSCPDRIFPTPGQVV